MLPSRAWELLLGSLLAFLPNRSGGFRPAIREATSLAGLSAIAWSIVFYTSKTPFPGVAALLPTLGTVSFIWANGSTLTLGGRILAWRPVVFVGQISYSLYLIHWPLIVFVMYFFRQNATWPWRAGIVAVSFVAAILSWRFIESPVRMKRILKSRTSLFTATAASLLLLLAGGFQIHRLQGLPTRFSSQTLNYAMPLRADTFIVDISLDEIRHEQLTSFGSSNGEIGCLVWGDSHAMVLMPCIDEVCRENGLRGLTSLHSATAPILDFSYRNYHSVNDIIYYNNEVIRIALKQKVRLILLAARWNDYSQNDPRFAECMEATVKRLTAEGIRVVIVRDVPKQVPEVLRLLACSAHLGGDVQQIGISLKKHRRDSEFVDNLFNRLQGDNVTVIDPAPLLTDEKGMCRAEMDGQALYFDDDHLSLAGALRLKPMFEQVFAKDQGERRPAD